MLLKLCPRRIRERRQSLGLTQMDAAAQAGIGWRTLQRWEESEAPFARRDTVRLLADCFDVEVAELILEPDASELVARHIYIIKTSYISPVERILGYRIDDAKWWEASRRGLYIEADVNAEQSARLEELPSVSVHRQKQHTNTAADLRTQLAMGWSKAAAELRA